MKNILNYYYGMTPEKVDNNGYFSYNNHLFCLIEYQRNIAEINSLVLLNNYMARITKINTIISNIYQDTLTYYDGKHYCLLLINYESSCSFFCFIPSFNDKHLDILKRNNWSYLWSNKIDYVEYQMKHLSKKYKNISESINYYIGLAENAISYFKMLVLDNVPLYISHRRMNEGMIYNPLELIIDYKVRDVVEYLKKCFFGKKKTIQEIISFINSMNFNYFDYLLLYCRFLYPSYYFDIYDGIINGNMKEQEIMVVTNLVNDYEALLYELFLLINKNNNMLGIEWINSQFR